ADAMHAVLAELEAEGIGVRRLTVSHAFHSPLLEPMLDGFEAAAARFTYRAPQLPLVTNLTGHFQDGHVAPDAVHWRRHSRQPVAFAAGRRRLAEHGCEVYLELGPTPTLLAMGRRCLPDVTASWLPSLRKGQDWRALLESLAALHAHGAAVDWKAFDEP